MWALYCLVQFYKITHEDLKHIRPLAKFLCFKAIVFATWWQGVIIAALRAVNVIPRSISGIPKPQASLQDFIICIEVRLWFYTFAKSVYNTIVMYDCLVSVDGDGSTGT